MNKNSLMVYFFCLAFFFLFAFGCSKDKPTSPIDDPPPITPVPDQWSVLLEPSFNFRGIWVNSINDAWAVNQGGQVLHDDGTGWRVVHEDERGVLAAIWGFSNTDIYVSGVNYLMHYDGSTWEDVVPGPPNTVDLLWGAEDGTLFGAGYYGAMSRKVGETWEILDSGTNESIQSLWGTSSNQVWAVDRLGQLLFFDGGSWALFDPAPPIHGFSVWASGLDNVVLVGSNGVAQYDGQTWELIPELNYLGLRGIWGSGPNNIHVVGSQIAHFDGNKWSIFNRDSDFGLTVVHGTDEGIAYAGGPLNELWAWNSIEWGVQVPQGMTQWFTNVWCVSDDLVLAFSGDHRKIYAWNGLMWAEQDVSGCALQPIAVWGTPDGVVYVAGSGDCILEYDGVEWISRQLDASYAINDLWGSSAENIYAVGSDMQGRGRVIHYDGVDWTVQEETWDERLRSISGRGANDIFLVTANSGISHYAGLGWEWMRHSGTENLRAVSVGKTNGFAVGGFGEILSLNEGKWEPSSSGVFNDLDEVLVTSGGGAVAIGEQGCILHFDGKSWSSAASPVNRRLYGIAESPRGTLFAVGADGVVLQSDP